MRIQLVLLLLVLSLSCTPEKSDTLPQKQWLGQSIHLDRILPITHTYHMFDGGGEKVGTMAFGWAFEDGILRVRDTSQFDDGSVYETVEMVIDTSDFSFQNIDLQMKVGQRIMDLQLSEDGSKLRGNLRMRMDTMEQTQNIDSTYNHDLLRTELYALMHTLDYAAGDSLSFNMLMETSMSLLKGQMYREGEERVTVPAGEFETTVVYLATSGGVIDNRIWISKEEPRKVVKFYVPGADLNIELVRSQ